MPKPAAATKMYEAAGKGRRAKPITDREKRPDVTGILLARPFVPERAARRMDPPRAPIHVAPMRKPRVVGPPWRISRAKTGIITT